MKIVEKMVVKRIINNNIVLCENFKGHEVIAIGSGLGYRKEKNDQVYPSEISKVYELVDNTSRRQIITMFEEVPLEIINLTQKIIDVAQKDLNSTFNVNLVIALADHINFSINQFKEGNITPALVSEEVKRFYKNEYNVGKKAIEMINDELGIPLDMEEATSIAFHFITAAEKRTNADSLKIMKGVKSIVEIVEKELNTKFDEESANYLRFVIHLKFFMRSVLFEQSRPANESLGLLFTQIKTGYDKANACADKIEEYVKEEYDYELSDEDRLYLVIHLVRLEKAID